MQGRRFELNRKTLSIILCIVLISVFSLTIAYAALSVTLNITGTAEISDASWNVRFDNIKVNSASVSISPKITNNTTITFDANLENPGEFYKFTVDIVNDGSIDAMIDSIIKTPELTSTQKKYIRYEVKYIDGQDISTKQILKSKETKTISVLFSFRNDIPVSDLPTTAANFNVQLQLVYSQADDTSTSIETGASKVNIVSGDMDTVGSEICIQEECFYVISSNSYSVTMLAKYNLFVGGVHDGNTWTAYGEEATGKQDATMLGWISNQSIKNGTTPFSNLNYWFGTDKYSSGYIYDSNSFLYSYVENYRKYLNTLGVTLDDARLITYEELVSLGCNPACSNAHYSWVTSSSYWSGSASPFYNYNYIMFAFSPGGFDPRGGTYSINDRFGVRPVITIPKTEF